MRAIGTAERLVARVARGDRQAFGRLYDGWAPMVLGLIRAVVGARGQAEQVLLAVFLQLWRTAAQYRPEHGSAQAWALDTAHRAAVAQVRATAAAEPRRRAGGELLRELTGQEREAVLLTYFGACTSREVARRLGVDHGAAVALIRTGLRRLARP